MGEIKITLESLYDLLRNEKKREDLQKLEGTFFIDVVMYLKEKQALLESKQKSTELFAIGDREKLEYELRSIKRILKEFYEKREKKMLEIALNKSRTGSDIIDTSAMLSMEREFYHKILRTLDDFRWGILQHLWRGELPNLPEQRKLEVGVEKEPEKKEVKPEQPRPTVMPTLAPAGETTAETSPLISTSPLVTSPLTPSPLTAFSEPASEPAAALSAALSASSTLSSALPASPTHLPPKIKITQAIPSFVWKDLKVYGPYEEGAEIEMFPEVAELMVRKGRAVWVG